MKIEVRYVIKLRFRNFFIGKDLNGKWGIISRNMISKYFKVGGDYSFYAYTRKVSLFKKVIPVMIDC